MICKTVSIEIPALGVVADMAIIAEHRPAGPPARPACPSIIMTVNKI